jgi:hypothetical protein
MANLPSKTGLLTVFMTAWLALSVIFAGIFVIVEQDHDHIDIMGHGQDRTSENCHICKEIQIAQRLIEAFGRLGVCMILVGFIAYIRAFIKTQTFFHLINLVESKMKMYC